MRATPRVVFFGTSEFAVPSLRALHRRSDVLLVVTQPDRPSGRGQRLHPTPVKSAARELGVATIEPERLRDAVGALRGQRADLFAVASYGKIIPQALLDVPRLCALNVHPSLLPLYRGATPLQSALRDGRRESGVTIIVMDAGMDTGDVVLQERTPIGDDETYGELHDRLAALGAELLVRAADAAADGALERTPQRDFAVSEAEIAATLTRPLSKSDLLIDWASHAARIVDQIRALSPAPLARASFAGDPRPVKIERARVVSERDLQLLATSRREPGTLVTGVAYEPAVVCGDGFVVLERVIPPDRRSMTGREYASLRATERERASR